MNFLQFWNEHDVTTLWLTTVGILTGMTLTHNTETDDDAYCNLGEWVSENECLHNLNGEVVDGQWRWDGDGDVQYLANSVLNVKAR